MAVSLVQTAQFAGTTNNTSMSFTLGSTPSVGNLLIFIALYGTSDGPLVTPSGWTLQTSFSTANAGFNESVAVFYRIVQSGDGTSWSLAYDTVADNANSGFLIEVSGQAASNFFNQIGATGSSGTPSPFATLSKTPSVVGCLAISAFGNSGTGGTNTATFSSGWVQDQYANASFQPGWLSHKTALTTDTTTAISNSITSMNGGGNNSANVIMLIAPAVTVIDPGAFYRAPRVPNRFVGPMALRSAFKQPTPNYPITPTFIPPYPDTPMGMNIGNDQTGGGAWNATENDTDLLVLTSKLRRKRVRIAMPSYNDASGIANMRQLALNYKANGFYVSYGITGNGATQNATTYAAWKAQVPTEAAWASANKIDCFYIGNEEDWQAQIGNFGTVTDSTVRTDVLSLATSLKSSYPNMRIVYSTAQGTVSQWHTAGTGNLDGLGFNMYDTLDNFGPNITYFMSQIGSKYFVSEWGSNHGYADMIAQGYTDLQYANDLAARYAILVQNNLEAYFFAYRYGDNTATSGNFNIIDNNNNPLPGYEQAFGAPALPYPQAAPLRIPNKFVGPMAMRRGFRQPYIPQSAGPVTITSSQTQQGKSRITQVGPFRTNLIANPSFETGTTGWSGFVSTISQDNTTSYIGSNSLKIIGTTSAVAYFNLNLVAGQTYTLQMRVKGPASKQVYFTSRGNGSASPTTLTGGWDLLTWTFTAAQGSGSSVEVHCDSSTTTLNIDAVMLEAGNAVNAYFDGSTSTASWTGTANNSTSTMSGYIQLGKSRITATTSRTQTGKSRIQVTTTKTQQGVSRITVTTLKTLAGKSRVTATTSKTQLGKSRITASATKTQQGKSRITVTVAKTQQGRSRITATATRTQSGKSRITATTTKTQAGKSRITVTTTKTQLGKSRLATGVNKTQLGKSRITAKTTKTQQGKSRITVTTTKTQAGKSRIQITSVRTQLGKSRIKVTTTRTQLGKSRITAKTTRTQSGKSRITNSSIHTQLGLARILVTRTKTQLGKSRITAKTLRTILGKASLRRITSRTQSGKSAVRKTTQQTMQGVARIFVAPNGVNITASRVTELGIAVERKKLLSVAVGKADQMTIGVAKKATIGIAVSKKN